MTTVDADEVRRIRSAARRAQEALEGLAGVGQTPENGIPEKGIPETPRCVRCLKRIPTTEPACLAALVLWEPGPSEVARTRRREPGPSDVARARRRASTSSLITSCRQCLIEWVHAVVFDDDD